MADGNNTAVLERPQEVVDQTSKRYDEVLALESAKYNARAIAINSNRKEDQDAFEALEKQYDGLSAKDRVEAQLKRFLHTQEGAPERKEGKKPSDPGGEALYFKKKTIKIDGKDKVVNDSQGNPILELFSKGGLFNGWTNNDEAGNKGTVTQVREHITKLTDNAVSKLPQIDKFNGLGAEEQEFVRRFLKDNAFGDTQARVIIQFLVAGGLTPEQARARLTPEKLVESLLPYVGERGALKYGFIDFFSSIGIKDAQNVMRFITPKQFERENNEARMGVTNGVEDLAWKIMMSDLEGKFDVDGIFPALEFRIIKDKAGNIDYDKSKNLYVNKGNLNRWILERVDELWDSKPHDFVDYFSEVRLKTGPISMYDIPLGEIFHAKATFLKSKYDWLDTTDEYVRDLQLDPWIQLYGRTAYLTDELKIQGDENAILEGAKAIHNENKATRKTFGSNMIYWMATSPLNAKGTTEAGEFLQRDGVKGAAWNETLLIYQHLSDFGKLQEILGKDSNFFTKKAMREAMEQYALKISGHTGRLDVRGFLGDDLYAAYESAFDDRTGKVRDQAAFIKIVNIFNAHAQDSNQVKFVREKLVINAIKEKFHGFKTERGEEDGYSLRYAERLAYDWTAPSLTGTWALNDESAQAFKGWTKWIRTGLYRMKMAGDKSGMRAGALGNPRTNLIFKQLYVPFIWAVNTKKSVNVVDEQGNVVYDKDNKPMKRQKSAIEVMHELQQLKMNQMKYIEDMRGYLEGQGKSPEEIRAEIDKKEKELQTMYLNKAGEFDFNDNAQRTHQLDHIDRIDKLWKILINAKEINFEKFTKYDPYSPGMPRFDRAEFQKEIQDEFLKPLRYAYQTYGDINFNMTVRGAKIVPDSKPFTWKTVWEDMPLGQALFGHELLDRPEFWKRSKSGIPLRDKTGQRLIDYNKVQDNKILVWKQWAIMKIAADIQQHRMRHSMDIKHHPTYYNHIFEALESIPGSVWANEFHMSETMIPTNFFDHEDMDILKKKGLASPFMGMTKIPFTNINLAEKLTKARFYLNWIWRDLRAKEDEEGTGIGIMFGMFFKDVFKGM